MLDQRLTMQPFSGFSLSSDESLAYFSIGHFILFQTTFQGVNLSALSQLVNDNPAFRGRLDGMAETALPPVTATPAIAVTAAKAAGAVIGGGAVSGAAYAAYRAVIK